jgi:hypothetical protein
MQHRDSRKRRRQAADVYAWPRQVADFYGMRLRKNVESGGASQRPQHSSDFRKRALKPAKPAFFKAFKWHPNQPQHGSPKDTFNAQLGQED